MGNHSKALTMTAAGFALALVPMATFAQHYTQTNLVSDLASFNGLPVATQDPTFKNSWGLTRSASSPWWINNSGTGTSALYTGAGKVVSPPSPVVVPSANAQGTSAPTGIVFNGTTDFMIKNVPGKTPAPAAFIFATSNGTISAWNPAVTPLQLAVNQVVEKGAVFTGLTLIEFDGDHFLLAANFAQSRIEVFDTNFNRVQLPGRLFDDDKLRAGFAPYNVQAVGDNVVVTYAQQNAQKTGADDANCGEECGFVDVFDIHGGLRRRLQPVPEILTAPWGVALAPRDFGFFSHALLIGNRFGGTIAAFNIVDGRFLGNLLDANGSPISIPGLWALEFDNRGNNQASPSPGPALFFAAGINNYADGLFGTLTPVTAELNAEDHQ